jgi:hypothetical protein
VSDRVALLLARRAEVFPALAARRRLMLAWGIQSVIWATIFANGIVPGLVPPVVRGFLPLVSMCVLCWSAVEGMLMQRALREPTGVWVLTFVGGLVPLAAPVLAVVMLIESVAVLKIARRLRGSQCGMCGYDLRGIGAAVCPECGWKPDA